MDTVEIKLDTINDPAFQPRDALLVEGIEALANSIAEIGLINPIVVRKAEKGYELIAGTRRCHAFQMLGRDTIPAKVVENDTREATLLQFSENFHRQDLNPIQQAHILSFMLQELNYSMLEITKITNRSKDWVSKQLTLLDLPDEAQEAVAQGKLSPSVAQELRLIPDKKLQSDYINYAIQGGCTEKAARDWTRQARATIAARDMRIAQREQNPEETEEEIYQPPPLRTCALCGAPEDKVLLEEWDICWHCGQKLKPQS